MAVTSDSHSEKIPVSFSIAGKSSSSKVLTPKLNNDAHASNDDVKDYVTSAEGKVLNSVKPEKNKSKPIIPLIKQNNWRVNDSNFSELDKEAAAEILNDLENGDKEMNESGNIAIPMLLRNRIPTRTDGEVSDEKFDISIRPEESTINDYEDMPISSFGSAMLRGMGWNEGQAIGVTNKVLVQPIEYIPRHKGLGLGADKKVDETQRKRKRKMGDSTSSQDVNKPIIEKDGRVRHTRAIDEKVSERQFGFYPGNYLRVERGPHKDLYGQIISVDEDTARVSAKLSLNNEIIQISQHSSIVIDREEYLKKSKCSPTSKKNGNCKVIEKLEKPPKNIAIVNPNCIPSGPAWLLPHIRVRIISKLFKHGMFYNKKVRILDCNSKYTCTCQTEEMKTLEDVHQNDLETVIPKRIGSFVMIVSSKNHRGKVGKLYERDKKKSMCTVQLTSNKEFLTVGFDDLCEYTGDLPDDDFI